jgi:hypothetical protein
MVGHYASTLLTCTNQSYSAFLIQTCVGGDKEEEVTQIQWNLFGAKVTTASARTFQCDHVTSYHIPYPYHTIPYHSLADSIVVVIMIGGSNGANWSVKERYDYI